MYSKINKDTIDIINSNQAYEKTQINIKDKKDAVKKEREILAQKAMKEYIEPLKKNIKEKVNSAIESGKYKTYIRRDKLISSDEDPRYFIPQNDIEKEIISREKEIMEQLREEEGYKVYFSGKCIAVDWDKSFCRCEIL